MPSAPAVPLAIDLDVLKLPGEDVTLDDVERAAHALTGWQAGQPLVNQLLDVVEAYARGARAGRVPRRLGHDPGAVPVRTVACGRAHLDEHTCPVTVKREAVLPVVTTCVSCLGVVDQDGKVTPPLEPTPRADTRALDQASAEMEPAKRVRTGVRNEPTMTPEQLLLVPDTEVDALTEAQRAARHVLMTRSQVCSTCALVKGLDDFYKDRARLTGRASRCKDCANAASAARRRAKTP